jgi:large conductance mechanosensitive channel
VGQDAPVVAIGPGGTKVKDALKDFKTFILRGNVIDLAVGVAIGAAFASVVTAFTKNLLTPILAIPGSKPSFAALDFSIRNAQFKYGAFLDELIAFVITAAALFFLVVRPINQLMARRKTEPEVMSTTRDCPYCLSSIPIAASRCAFCTADVGAAS